MARPKKEAALEIEWKDKSSCVVRFASDIFAEENTMLIEILKTVTGSEKPRILLVADTNVVQHTEGLGTRIGKYVQTHGITLAASPVVMTGSEKIKGDNFQSVQRILMAALEAKIGVNDVMLVIGGGSLMDVAGFAAAQVRGGMKTVRIPTTLAAMMDGAFSTAAALNVPNIKDAIRLPYRPSAILIDPTFAQTLLDGVWRGGLGEAVRQATLTDASLMKKIAKKAADLRVRDLDATTEIVRAVVESRVKKGTTGFALWSAARLESMSGYKLPHGYSVPMGVCIDSAYAVVRGYLSADDRDFICGALSACGALEGLIHSRHLLQRQSDILYGLDSWRLATGTEELILPAGVGKSVVEESPDRLLFEKVLKELSLASIAG